MYTYLHALALWLDRIDGNIFNLFANIGFYYVVAMCIYAHSFYHEVFANVYQSNTSAIDYILYIRSTIVL